MIFLKLKLIYLKKNNLIKVKKFICNLMIYSIFFRNNILYKLKRYSKLNAFKEINFTNKSIFIDLGGNNGVVSQYI